MSMSRLAPAMWTVLLPFLTVQDHLRLLGVSPWLCRTVTCTDPTLRSLLPVYTRFPFVSIVLCRDSTPEMRKVSAAELNVHWQELAAVSCPATGAQLRHTQLVKTELLLAACENQLHANAFVGALRREPWYIVGNFDMSVLAQSKACFKRVRDAAAQSIINQFPASGTLSCQKYVVIPLVTSTTLCLKMRKRAAQALINRYECQGRKCREWTGGVACEDLWRIADDAESHPDITKKLNYAVWRSGIRRQKS